MSTTILSIMHWQAGPEALSLPSMYTARCISALHARLRQRTLAKKRERSC